MNTRVQLRVLTADGLPCNLVRLLGSGGQGEVFEVRVDGQALAMKWYFPHQTHEQQRTLLREIVRLGPPSSRFLWPLEVVASTDGHGLGYLMLLREERFRGIVELLSRRAEPSFDSLCRSGFELADSFLQLHAKGLCYRDISFGNVFLDPNAGEVRICDNDNVAVAGQVTGTGGTIGFMAPEIVRGEALPSTESDLHALAVLLFHMFLLSHPLEGRQETKVHCLDLLARNQLYGSQPRFIFDPDDASNRPVPGIHDNAIIYWQIYPDWFRAIITRAFTVGLREPQRGRVRESEWRKVFVQLRDSILICHCCGTENFYDAERIRAHRPHVCWHCNRGITLPPRLRLGRNVVILNRGRRLYSHHLGEQYDFSLPLAEVVRHSLHPASLCLRNLSPEKWVLTTPDGAMQEVPSGGGLRLNLEARISFGRAVGEIRP